MSIYSGLNSIRRERAMMERTRVLMTSMIQDAKISELMREQRGYDYFEGVDEDEIDELIERLPESNPREEDDQVERILNSDRDLGIDGILGIEESEEGSEEEDLELPEEAE